MPSRINVLPKMIDSIYNQVDEIRIYFNEIEKVNPELIAPLLRDKIKIISGNNLTDNGKFYFISDSIEYYFMMDDDFIYPSDYVEKTLSNIKKHKGCVITYHGRKLDGVGLNYYHGHRRAYRCMGTVSEDVIVDVAGTGVTAFDTYYFRPQLLFASMHLRMSDLVFAKEMAECGIQAICCKHELGWMKMMDSTESIFESNVGKITIEQNKLADYIYTKKFL
jgi:hypothetical protein